LESLNDFDSSVPSNQYSLAAAGQMGTIYNMVPGDSYWKCPARSSLYKLSAI